MMHGASNEEGQLEQLRQRTREALVGRYFSNQAELRQIAERLGLEVMSGNALAADDNQAQAMLRQPGVGAIRVEAARTAVWQPFFIMDVAFG